jgi:hypothetical protein
LSYEVLTIFALRAKMVGTTGIESRLICPFSKGPEHVCTQIDAQSQKCPPELRSLIKAWTFIPRHLQAAILSIASI